MYDILLKGKPMKKNFKIIIPIAVSVLAIIAATVIMVIPADKAEELDDITIRLETAQRYLVELDYDRAIAEFEAIINIEPMNVDAYLGLAEAYQGKDETDKAIEILEKGNGVTGDGRIKAMLDTLKTLTQPADTQTSAVITDASSLLTDDTENGSGDFGFEWEAVGENAVYCGHTYQMFKVYSPRGANAEIINDLCIDNGGYWAHINDSAENDFLYALMLENGISFAYFGYSDAKNEDRWEWLDGKTSDYVNWADGEPNNDQDLEHYAVITSSGKWNDGKFENDSSAGAYIFCESDTADERNNVLSVSDQLRVYSENADVWTVDREETFGVSTYYTAGDFDRDGNIDVISSYVQGSGIYSTNDFFSIRDGKVIKLDFNNSDYNEAEPDLADTYVWYYQYSDGIYRYLVSDCERAGAAGYSVRKFWFSISDDKIILSDTIGGMVSENIGSNEVITYYDKDMNEISEDEYYNIGYNRSSKYYADDNAQGDPVSHDGGGTVVPDGLISMKWFSISNEEFPSDSELYEKLEDSYNMFEPSFEYDISAECSAEYPFYSTYTGLYYRTFYDAYYASMSDHEKVIDHSSEYQ